MCAQYMIYWKKAVNIHYWITIILNGTVQDDEIYNLIDIRFGLTEKLKHKKREV